MLRSFVKYTTPFCTQNNKNILKVQINCRSLSYKNDLKPQNDNNDTDDGVGNGVSGIIKHRQLELDKVSIKLILI